MQRSDFNNMNFRSSENILSDSLTLDSIPADSIALSDTIRLSSDSITLATDTTSRPKDGLDAQVDYAATDSIVFTAGNMGFLYGNGEVYYKDINLKAEQISMDMDNSIVHATYGLDSIGEEFGFPVFNDSGTDYEAKGMSYNFKTRKGYITEVITEQGEGHVLAGRAKKNEDNSFFMCDGKYTTCDHEHPHWYFMMTKAKVRPKKDIVTGPAYLVIEDFPLYPIGIPFGFFPFSDKYSSGVIMPSYVDEMDRGFGLRDGGYYFAINEYVDLAVRGEIYTKGSWGLSAQSSYRKRYRFNGNANISYLFTKYGEREDPDYSESKDFKISWSHTQDPKANMYRTLSASVNFSTTSYNRNQLNEIYGGDYTNNTKNSTITLTQRFPNSPFTISANVSAAQVSRDTTVSLTLPNLSVNMSRIYPFKRKEAVGAERWYEKIQMSYSADIRNSITTKEDRLLKSNIIKDWRNGIKHTIPISATFNLFNYLNITPSINYTERWYTQKVGKAWDPNENQNVVTDTTYSFNRVFDFNYSLSFQTKLFGFYEPLFKIGNIQRIRHVFTPSISFSGRPDFSDPKWGYYETYYYLDREGNPQSHTYSPYQQGIFGVPQSGKQGSIGFSFENNLEMKVGAPTDTARIISLVDNLGIRFSYNMMLDSLNWSDITTSIRLKLSKSLIINLNATFDPYMYDPIVRTNPATGERSITGLRKVDKLRIKNGKGIGRLMSTGYSFNPSINQDTFKKLFGKKEDKDSDDDAEGETDPLLADTEDTENEEGQGPRRSRFEKTKDDKEYDEDGYVKNEVKWNLGASYSFNYAYDRSRIDTKNMEYKRTLTHNLGINGSIQPTKNWSLSFTTSYDFSNNRFAYLNCSASRNLHCFSLTASFIPIGPYKSYFVSLRANASMLRDLKYDKRGRSSSFDPEWY